MSDADIERYRNKIKAIPTAILEAVRPALLRSANETADVMRMLAPVDEGDLKESITVTGPGEATPPYSQPGGAMTVPENAVAITVGDHVTRYPHLVEYGTTNAPAQQFFWPSIRLMRKKNDLRKKRAHTSAIKKIWGKK